MAKPAVFLDRDGVLNHVVLRDGKSYPPPSVDELTLISSSIKACQQLSQAGFLLVGATNQPDVATGKATRDQVEAINTIVRDAMGLQEMRVCYHQDSDDCQCRKPKPGLLLDAARDLDIDLSKSIMVGDRWKDVDAGYAAGCRTVFIDQGYTEKRPTVMDFTAPDLLSAVAWILEAQQECQ